MPVAGTSLHRNGLEDELFRDPKRMAALLVRAFSTPPASSVPGGSDAADEEVRDGDNDEEVDGGDTIQDPDEEATEAAAQDDDEEEEDNTEQVEEELEQQEEEQEEAMEKRPLDEDELEAAASALQTATRVVDELRLKVVLKGGRQLERQQHGASRDVVLESSNGSNQRPGIPMVKARKMDNDQCSRCSKSFNPFHRSKHCTTCGFAFCPKCVAHQQVLPTCFGYQSEPMRICDLCAGWFQKALDRYFEAMDLLKLPSSPPQEQPPQEQVQHSGSGSGDSEPVAHRGAGLRSFSSAYGSPVLEQANISRSEKNYVPDDSSERSFARRPNRRSQSISSTTKSPVTKPWFSGHLRAMHVNDRLPRKHKASTDANDPDGDEDSGSSRDFRVASRALSFGGSLFSSHSTGDEGYHRDHHRMQSPQTDNDMHSPAPDVATTPTRETSRSVEGGSTERVLQRQSSRRSRFGRSASFDLTSLSAPSQSPTASIVAESPAIEAKFARTSEVSSESSSLPLNGAYSDRTSLIVKKCFDDSDIVDARIAEMSTNETLRNDIDLPAAVLRFAVYETSAKENSGLRRALGFAKANPVLDRYTMELDCRQGVVRVKSVFMHRFWWFHCDSVQSFTVGSSTGMARLVIFNGGHGNQTLELKFANDEERDQFREAMECCRSGNFRSIRSFERRLNLPPPDNTSSPVMRRAMTLETDGRSSTSVEKTVRSPEYTGVDGVCTPNSPLTMSVDVDYFPGETVIKDTELPATLLIGPGGESGSFETSIVWGRLRGMIAVTNYRVLFIPFDRVPMLTRRGEQFSIAYIPLFAITQVQLLYPGGRRTKSGRTYYAGMTGSASIIAVACKDVRALRFQLDGPHHLSDERTQRLHATIGKMVDAAQRFVKVEGGVDRDGAGASNEFVGLTGSSSGGVSTESIENSDDGGRSSGSASSEAYSLRSSFVKSPFGPINLPSPVLRPTFDSSVLRERSASFAFSYVPGWIPPDQNGWNLFVDEREFKRQIGGDSSVSPFLKYYQNAKGNICKTYPAKLLLPSSMNSATLVKVANFRAKNRLPVITYYHRRNRCVLTRSSQPLLGNLLSGNSNISDQLLVGVYRRMPDIIKNQSQSSASSRPIYIFDARKPKASTGNRLMGKGGVETSQDYPGAVIHHLNIANMYRMQSSYLGLMKLALPGGVEDDKAWWSSVESTRWLEHVRIVLDGAMKIARVLELEGSSALVHCSDGWDRTAQLTSLAQLMIDPYFRTIRGFAVLVEKDWCAFGHKFCERLGGDRNKDPQRSKSSPIMFQFLDAVWQIQRQYPSAFEFNERFLLHLANAMTSGLYGTFLYDSRLQRDVNDVDRMSVSVWTPVLLHPAMFRNAEYAACDGPLWPWVTTKMIRLWENYFFQWHPKFYNCQWVSTVVHPGARRHGAASSVTSSSTIEEEKDEPSNTAKDTPGLNAEAVEELTMIPPLSLATPS